MPRKKLTKAQVKSDISASMSRLYNMIVDKLNYPDSHVPLSLAKLLDLHKVMSSAWKRMK